MQAMDITYLGHSSFRLKGKQKTVVTDPFDARLGKFPKNIEADIVTISHNHNDHNQVDLVKGDKFVIDNPGEYEVGGVSVIGVPTWHDQNGGADRGRNTVYVIELDNLRIAHMGDLGHKLTQETVQEVGAIDILMIPIGGTYTIDPKTAAEVMRQVDPWIVIPMHYQTPETRLTEKLAEVGEFLKELGKAELQPIPKFSVTADRLPAELQVVVLDRKS